ncbi:MAG TPA: nucleotidyltransferase family protein [Armatimonadota bacterium]|nr:nucleotidyltransferase family protein [Armatimonadota bacterium]HQK93551.1 nucleotidyltransferase family protein [Armatimonadota bacterium]
MKAVILSAGYGTRLRPITDYLCKALVPVNGVPVLERVIRRLAGYGFNEFVVAVSHLGEQCVHYFGNGERLGVTLRFSITDEPQGTAGEIAAARHWLEGEPDFLVYYGDILSNFDVAGLVTRHQQKDPLATIGLVRSYRVATGIAEVNADGRVVAFVEKPPLPQPTNAAIMMFSGRALPWFRKGEDISIDVIPAMLRADEWVEGFIDENAYWHDVGQPASLARAIEAVAAEEGDARTIILGRA